MVIETRKVLRRWTKEWQEGPQSPGALPKSEGHTYGSDLSITQLDVVQLLLRKEDEVPLVRRDRSGPLPDVWATGLQPGPISIAEVPRRAK